MADLVERLHNASARTIENGIDVCEVRQRTILEAANEITVLRSELTASAAREAALRDALKHIAAYGDVDDTVDAALAQPSPRAEALLAVVEAARRAVQCGGTLLLADALRALDQP